MDAAKSNKKQKIRAKQIQLAKSYKYSKMEKRVSEKARTAFSRKPYGGLI